MRNSMGDYATALDQLTFSGWPQKAQDLARRVIDAEMREDLRREVWDEVRMEVRHDIRRELEAEMPDKNELNRAREQGRKEALDAMRKRLGDIFFDGEIL